ncbi:MAG: Ig-like domain-containing protein [Burkholderiales bacterium]|nr:Ig-like domain-containing protein [Anaerolineae bacterium]
MRSNLKLVWFALFGLVLAGCNLSTTPPTPIPTPDIPMVQFVSPTDNATIIEGTDMDIQIFASDAGIGVARIELYVDEQLHQTGLPEVSAAVPDFTVLMNWRAQSVGRHFLTARAFRPDGTSSDEARLIVEVLPNANVTPVNAAPLATQEAQP